MAELKFCCKEVMHEGSRKRGMNGCAREAPRSSVVSVDVQRLPATTETTPVDDVRTRSELLEARQLRSLRIAELLSERGMTQTQAATVLGIPQPKLSRMLRGQFRGFSVHKLMGCLTQLGQDVHIVIRQRPDQRSTGALCVTFA